MNIKYLLTINSLGVSMSKLIYLVIILIIIIGILSYISLNLYLVNEKLNREVKSISNEAEVLRDTISNLQSKLNNLNSSYQLLQSDYKKLKNKYDNLLNEYNSVAKNFSYLKNKYEELRLRYKELQILYNNSVKQFHNLQEIYQELKDDYDELNTKYFELRAEYQKLSLNYSKLKMILEKIEVLNGTFMNNYNAWRAFATSYMYLNNETIERVFNQKELELLQSTISEIITDPKDLWNSIEELYRFVSINIFYSSDPPVPLPPTLNELLIGTFNNQTRNELIQSPSETLARKEGDCEDQAILLYALIKSYLRYVLNEDRIIWLMLIRMRDGQGHMAIAFPSEGGKITILDPAGHYYTKNVLRKLSSNNPFEELMEYSNSWSLYGGIEWIWLLRIDIDKGIYSVEAEGSIETIANYIATNYK